MMKRQREIRFPLFSIIQIMKKRHQQKLVILSIVLFILLNAPILLLFNSSQILIGMPVIYVYLFGVWGASCITSFIIFKKFDEQLFTFCVGYSLSGTSILHCLFRRETKKQFLGKQSLCLCTFTRSLLLSVDLLRQHWRSCKSRFRIYDNLYRTHYYYSCMDLY